MGMPLKLRALLWWYQFNQKKPLHEMEAKEARNASESKAGEYDWLLDDLPIAMTNVENRQVYMRDSEQIGVRIYQPTIAQNLPVIVYFHGGGFVFNGLDSHDKVCRRVAAKNEAIVFAVDYRLSPEYKFPTPVHDAYDATFWVAKKAKEFGGDASRMTLMGDSAGANLATVVSIMLRDNKGPKIANQILVYPCTDARLGHPSIDKYAKGYFLTKKLMHWFIAHYARTDEDFSNPLMSPFLAKDLSNLPPAFILTAEYDPLKDEGMAYAKRLKEAGNIVKHKDYGGMIHAFFSIPKIAGKALEAHEDIKAFRLKNATVQVPESKTQHSKKKTQNSNSKPQNSRNKKRTPKVKSNKK